MNTKTLGATISLILKMTLFVAVLTTGNVMSQTEGTHAEHKQAHTSYVGSHGMALFMAADGEWYAYHMGLYYAPHDYQVMYRVSLSQTVQSKLSSSSEQITILPKPFDLNRMISNQSFVVDVDFYSGHFERNGKKRLEGAVSFDFLVYKKNIPSASSLRHLANGENAAVEKERRSSKRLLPERKSEFDTVDITPLHRLVIHRIGGAPSFDLIVPQTIDQYAQSCIAKGKNGLNEIDLIKTLSGDVDDIVLKAFSKDCFGVEPVYIEYKDFKSGP